MSEGIKTTEETTTYKNDKQPKKLGKKGIGRWLVGLSVLIVLLGGSFAIYRQVVILPSLEAKLKTLTVPVQKVNLPVTVSANGTISAQRSINLSPKTAGILKRLLVKEGDVVQQGQILAYMDNSNLLGQLTQSKGQLNQQEANLQKLIAGNRPQDIASAKAQLNQQEANLQKLIAGNRSQDIASAKSKLDNAQSTLRQAELTFSQNQRLYKQGALSQRDFENSRASRDSAQAQVADAQQQLNLQKVGSRQEDIQQARATVKQKEEEFSLQQAGSRPEDIASARAQVLSAAGSVQTIQTQINDTIIRAPFSGVVTRKFADPGAFVTPTTAGSAVSSATSSSILSLASENQVVADVAETNISQMYLGQKAAIEADAYPGKTFSGEVVSISPISIVQQNVTSFEVKTSIPADSQKLLRSGMNVSVDFAAGELKNVLVVPTVAIVRETGKTGVYIEAKNHIPEFIPITTGVTVNDKTEVRSGLQENQQVFISFPEGKRPQSGLSGPPPR